ncbi:MAG: GspE/PulE family protein [Campylobacterales bacterium]|nr:GspE/PulE family protein [Campylobacterales bacterium]
MLEIKDQIIDYNLISTLNINILKEYKIIPINKNSLSLLCFCAVEDENIMLLLNMPVKVISKDINYEQVLFYLEDIEIKKEIFNLSISSMFLEHESINEFLLLILKYACTNKASDIHFDINEKYFSVRFRIDGLLKHFFNFDKKLFPILSSVLKLYSNEDITQSRKPLSGRFSKLINNKEYDFRFSSMPTIFGESIVLRILDKLTVFQDFKVLGFSKESYDLILRSLSLTNGIILVTGPTGSGKTTTLYSMLNILAKQNKKIITIEDPVEYRINSIQQVEVNEKIGLTYKEILKNILRQDPDIILIGEIRDELSLSIAMQAALTGHLVLATLHTNDSLETINRLKDLKAANYLIANTVKTIISQRLVLKLCTYCNAKGCAKCNYTKYKNREVISECLYINKDLSKMISDNISINEIKQFLEKNNFISLYKDAHNKVKNNITSLNEVYRVLKQYL